MRHLINLIERAEQTDLQALKAEGYDISEILYHGTRRDLSELQKGHGRTAHIYTSPDPRTASYYGAHIHLLVAKHGREADLTHPNELTRQLAVDNHDFFIDCYEVEQRVEHGEDAEQAAIDYTETMLLSGMMWERPVAGQTLQDRILDAVFALGYDSIRINDVSTTGSPLSVVFDGGENLKIIGIRHWGIGGFRD